MKSLNLSLYIIIVCLYAATFLISGCKKKNDPIDIYAFANAYGGGQIARTNSYIKDSIKIHLTDRFGKKMKDAKIKVLSIDGEAIFKSEFANDSGIVTVSSWELSNKTGRQEIVFDVYTGYRHSQKVTNSPFKVHAIAYSNANLIYDVEGNEYRTVKIGEQTWMAENLRTTKLNDGTDMVLFSEESEEHIIIPLYDPAYGWLHDDKEYALRNKFGALYSGNAVETGKICPIGWHVPKVVEFKQLFNYVETDTVDHEAWEALRAFNLKWPLWGTDYYGFTLIESGAKHYVYVDDMTRLWASDEVSIPLGGYHHIQVGYGYIYTDHSSQVTFGYCIRCIKDD